MKVRTELKLLCAFLLLLATPVLAQTGGSAAPSVAVPAWMDASSPLSSPAALDLWPPAPHPTTTSICARCSYVLGHNDCTPLCPAGSTGTCRVLRGECSDDPFIVTLCVCS